MPTLDSLYGQLACNKRIASSLLDVLLEAGDPAARSRVLRAIGPKAAGLRNYSDWLEGQRISEMLASVPVDPRLARRVGQGLVRPGSVGLSLCYSGLATPEKAYRRCQQLLARESEEGHYEPREIGGEVGTILFHPNGPATGLATGNAGEGETDGVVKLDAAAGTLMCAVREGMLETIPMLFGLVPARVRETQCAYRGAAHCTFEVSWSRSPRTGLLAGASLAALLGAGLAWGASPGILPMWVAWAAGGCLTLLGAGAGRSFDLARQLEAVAGSRRGQLALLDQLDASLAEKLDQVAKFGGGAASVAAASQDIRGLTPVVHRAGPVSGVGADAEGVGAPGQELSDVVARSAGGLLRDIQKLRTDLSNLHGRLADLGEDRRDEEGAIDGEAGRAPRADAESLLRSCATQGRRIEEQVAELSRGVAGAAGSAGAARQQRGPLSLAGVVERAVRRLRPELPSSIAIEIDSPDPLAEVVGDADQLEFVLDQLLRNAAAAVEEQLQGHIRVALCETAAGVEMVVEDDGSGIEHHTVDEAFDPFFAGQVAGVDQSFGLPVCFRIISEHGGQLHVQSEEGQGSRVSVILPPVPSAH